MTKPRERLDSQSGAQNLAPSQLLCTTIGQSLRERLFLLQLMKI
jgi:hypothetical protein